MDEAVLSGDGTTRDEHKVRALYVLMYNMPILCAQAQSRKEKVIMATRTGIWCIGGSFSIYV